MRRAIGFLVLITIGSGTGGAAAQDPAPLTSIRAVKSRSAEEAARKLPVRLQAVVTSSDAGSEHLFLQDETGGIFVVSSPLTEPVARGDFVEVVGVTDPGAFVPQVIAEQVHRVGQGELPAAPEATAQMLMEAAWDGRRVVVDGLVGNVESFPAGIWLTLFLADGPIAACLYDRTVEQVPGDLPGARVRVSGISSPICNSQRQVIGARLHVGLQEEFEVRQTGRVDLENLPVTPVQQVAQPAEVLLTKIQGTVTASIPAWGFCLQDESGGILVRNLVPAEEQPGSRLELLGFPHADGDAVVLALAGRRELGPGELPPPVPLTPDLLARGQHQQRRVRFEAKVLTVTPAAGSRAVEVVMTYGAAVLIAGMPEAQVNLQNLVSGCRVRVCGVLGPQAKAEQQGQSLRVHLARADDLLVVAGPPPSPTRVLLAALAVAGGGGVLAVSWSLTLRRRVRARTTELAASREQLKEANERLEQHVRERTAELTHALEGLQAEMEQRRRTEEELRRAKQAAEAANLAKSEFLANMSHELRTPMTSIMGYGELLQMDPPADERQQYLAIVQRNAQALLQLLNDILDLSRIEAGQMLVQRRACEPRPLVDEVLSLLRLRAEEKQLSLTAQYCDPLPATIRTDPVRLRQILVNLVGNAIKFTEAGRVQVRVSFASGFPARLCFAVEDTGIGMDPATVEKMFEPFTQADSSNTRRYGGSGLGLTICRRLADLLGGRITVVSQQGRGSTFTLALDLEPPEPAAVAQTDGTVVDCQPRAPAPPGDRFRGRVVLAEDAADSQEVLALGGCACNLGCGR